MTKSEAQTRADSLNADGDGLWFVRELPDGSFEPVRVKAPGFKPPTPLKTTTEAKPRPPMADDVRTSVDRNIGGPWGT